MKKSLIIIITAAMLASCGGSSSRYEKKTFNGYSSDPSFTPTKSDAGEYHNAGDGERQVQYQGSSQQQSDLKAIDDEVTTAYPFRKFKIKPVATMKRSLAIKDLRNIFERREDDYMQRYADVFKLSFLLVGINIGDMCLLKRGNVNAGRIEYNRQKTHKLYSIKIEPEAAELIKRYEGKKYLLNFCDSSSYRNFMARTNKNLRKLHEGMTTYWARHSWATVANELDIPDDVIGQALGHSPVSRVTDVYIRRSEKKIDEANRKVIDYVMKNMK